MLPEIIIACLFAVSAGIFAWLFFLQTYDKLLFYKDLISEITSGKFSELFLFVDVARYFYLYLGVVFLVPVILWQLSGDVLVGLVSFPVLLISPYLVLKILKQRRIKQFERQLPDAMVMIANSLRAGTSLAIAIDGLIRESPDPLRQEFSLLVRERKLGVPTDIALENMERRLPLEDLSMFLSAVRISREVGGDLAHTLEDLAETLRRKLTMEGKIESLTAQGKLQGIVMSSLPLLLMVALLKLEPAAMGKMFTTKMGWAVLFLIFCMQVFGFISIRKIVAIDV